MRRLISSFAAVTTVAVLASACAVDAGTEEDLNASLEEAACANPEGTNAMIAALAVAAGRELRRWNATADFTLTRGEWGETIVGLSSTGQARCTSGCPNLKALLFFQQNKYDGQIVMPGGVKLSASSYASRLISYLERQKICESRPTWNQDPNNCPAEEHVLTLAGTSPGPCDTYYTFNARTPSGGMLKQPSMLKNKLLWAGGSDNPYLAFTSTSGTVTIDPTFGMNEGGSSQSGSCVKTCTKFSATDINGKCCVSTNGTQQGKFARTAQANTYKCNVSSCY